MDDTTIDEWMNFFRDAGIPPNVSASYASSFCQNRIHLNMVLELNRDLLKELGVTLIGDAIAILRHAKSFHEQNVRQKILNLMSPEYRKPPDFCKKLPDKDVASIANSRRFYGDISNRDALPVENNLSATTVACKNSNNQEAMDLRQQTQLTSKQNMRSVTASQSQRISDAQNISVGTLQREDLQVCEAHIAALGETDTTEETSVPYIVSRSQNNLGTSYSECSPMRGPVESSSTLPARPASVPSSISGGNYFCRRNHSLKRPIQQSNFTTIVSTSEQPAGRLPYRTPNTPTRFLSPMPRIENNTLQDAPDDIIQTQGTKRKRTSSYHEQEQIYPNVYTESEGMRVARRPVFETQSTIETVDLEELQGQESSQLDGGLLREDVKNEMTTTENHTENHSSSELRCQLNLQREREELPIQICTRVLSQEMLQMPISPPDKCLPSQITSESQLQSHKASPSQLTLSRSSQSHLRYHPASMVCRESQSSLHQPSIEPQSSHAESSQANEHLNLELQNQKMMQCNPVRSSSATKFILATGKNINKKFKLLQSRPRMSYMTSAPHSSVCYQRNEVQKHVKSFAISRCGNRSVMNDTENMKENEELVQTGNASCVLQNGSETGFIGAGGDLLEEELGSLPDLNTERPSVRWDTHQLSKPVAQTSDSCMYEDSSSDTFRNMNDDAENNVQHERVPGQIFSRLGVKVELVSVDNNVCNTAVKNDALPSCRFGSSVKYKINKSKKCKNLSSEAAQEVTSVDGGQTKLRGILKSQTSTSKQKESMETEKEDQSQKMTADLLLESVTRSGAADVDMVSDAVQFQENSLSNDCANSEDGDYIYQDSENFCSDNEPQEELNSASTNGTSKTVRFGPVCVKEFEKNVSPVSGKTATVFRRLGARKK